MAGICFPICSPYSKNITANTNSVGSVVSSSGLPFAHNTKQVVGRQTVGRWRGNFSWTVGRSVYIQHNNDARAALEDSNQATAHSSGKAPIWTRSQHEGQT
jgi:hypothetical protein